MKALGAKLLARKPTSETAAAPAPPQQQPQPPPEPEFVYPDDDDAALRERFERVVPADLPKTFETFVSFVWHTNAGVGPSSWVEVTKPSSKPGVLLEAGMTRRVAGMFDESVVRVVQPKLIEYHTSDDGWATTYHKGRIVFKPAKDEPDKTEVIWTIFWSPSGMATSYVYSAMMKGFCNVALYQLERKITTGTVDPIAATDSATDLPAGLTSSASSASSASASDGSSTSTLMAGALQPGEKPTLQWAARLQTGYEGNLTPQQETAVKELEELLKREDPASYDLLLKHPEGPRRMMLRFLRAECTGKQRVFHPDRSMKRLVETLKFRQHYKADELLDRDPPFLETSTSAGPEYVLLDNEGRLVVISRAGIISVTMDTSILTDEQWREGLVCMTERRMRMLRESSKKMGHEVTATVVVYDLAGMGFASRKMLPFVQLIAGTANKHYVEMVDQIYVVNAPGVFTTLWGAVRSFLDPITASKVMIFGATAKERAKWRAALRAVCPPGDLPKEYGGDSADVVPLPAAAVAKGMKPPKYDD